MPKFYSLLICLALAVLPGCYAKQDATKALPAYRPLLMTRATLEQAVALLPAQSLRVPGKACRYGSYLLINERYEGLHLIDNRDPEHPQPVGFLRIPGSLSAVVRGSVLYADNAVDLVTIDLGTPGSAQVISRVRGVFPELPLPEEGVVEAGYRPENRPADAIVVGWQKVQ